MKKFCQSFLMLLLTVHLMVLAGCGKKEKQSAANSQKQPVVKEVTLQVLCIDSPAIAENAERRWSAEGLGKVQFTEMTSAEFTESDFQFPPDIDVVIYPTELMADLVARSQLLAIPKKYLDGEAANSKEMLQHQQKFLRRYGGEYYSLPLGDVYLTLMYNQKIFDELELKVPENWSEYGEVASKLREQGHLVEEPMGDGWAGLLLLSRAAAYVRSRGKVSTVFEIADMKSLVNTEPFVRALREMKAALGDRVDMTLSPSQIYRNLVAGEAAMGLTWPSSHFVEDDAMVNEDLAVARIPGASEWYNHLDSVWSDRDSNASIHMDLMGCTGRLVSVSEGAVNTSTAIEFASWLCSKSTSTSVSIESPHVSMFRATHLGQPGRWTGENISSTCSDQFGEVIQQISEADIVFLFPRIPGQFEYLDVLDQQVLAAVRGESKIQDALAEVSAQWDKITERIGRDEQVRKLRMSEGYSR